MRVAIKDYMAYYYGPTTVDITSYDTFKAATNGNGWDVDGLYGAQCVDAFMLINYNLGYPAPYAWAGPLGYSYEMWTEPTARARNASDKYDLIYNLSEVKRGDMIVFSSAVGGGYGHNAFADENYNGQAYIQCLGQNQFGAPFPTGGACFNVYGILSSAFLGAFRLKQWQQPTPPTPTTKKHKFPWFIYVNKWRDRNNYGII